MSSTSPSPPGVSWSYILTSSLLDRTWEKVSRSLARGWEICWMRQDQESRGCPAQGGGGGWESPGPPGEDSQAVLPPAKLWDVSVPWVTLESSFQTHFPACS